MRGSQSNIHKHIFSKGGNLSQKGSIRLAALGEACRQLRRPNGRAPACSSRFWLIRQEHAWCWSMTHVCARALKAQAPPLGSFACI